MAQSVILRVLRHGGIAYAWPGTPTSVLVSSLVNLSKVWIGVSADGASNQVYDLATPVATITAAGWAHVYQGSASDVDGSASASDSDSPDASLFVYADSLDQVLALEARCCASSVLSGAFALKQSTQTLDPDAPNPPCGAEAIFKLLAVLGSAETHPLTYQWGFQLLPADGDVDNQFNWFETAPLAETIQRVFSWPTGFYGIVDSVDNSRFLVADDDPTVDPNAVRVGFYAGGTVTLNVLVYDAGDESYFFIKTETFRLPGTDCGEDDSSSGESSSASASASASTSESGEPTGLFIPHDDITAFGDSITVGLNATANNGYVQRFAANYGLSLNQLAVSARGVWQMALNAFQGPLPADTYVVAMAGLNDYRRSGVNTRTDNKVIGCYRSLLVEQFVDVGVDSNQPDTIWSGAVPTVFSGASLGARSGDLCNYIQTFGKCEWNFNGTAVAVGIIGERGVEGYGTVKIYIDGVLQITVDTASLYDGISDGAYDNNRGPYAIVMLGLTAGAHVVRFEGQGDGYCVLDYFATLKNPAVCKPVVLCEIPHLNAAGYATVPDQADDAILDAGSALIEQIVNEFSGAGFPVLYFPTNDFYDTGSGISGDDIHPSDVGHGTINAGLITTVEAV